MTMCCITMEGKQVAAGGDMGAHGGWSPKEASAHRLPSSTPVTNDRTFRKSAACCVGMACIADHWL